MFLDLPVYFEYRLLSQEILGDLLWALDIGTSHRGSGICLSFMEDLLFDKEIAQEIDMEMLSEGSAFPCGNTLWPSLSF